MRYFLAVFALCVLATVGVLGFRGSHFRQPPLYIFPDMERQPKLRPQTANAFFDDGLSSRQPVAGTIARTQPIHVGDKLVYPWQDSPITTGFVTGTTNFVELNPLPVTDELLHRGQQVFDITCAACHSKVGDGNGTPKRIGAMVVVGNLHDKRIVELAEVELRALLFVDVLAQLEDHQLAELIAQVARILGAAKRFNLRVVRCHVGIGLEERLRGLDAHSRGMHP